MNRRSFFTSLTGAAALPQIYSTPSIAQPLPFETMTHLCGVCGYALWYLDRSPERTRASCDRCRRTWLIEFRQAVAKEIPFVDRP